MEFPGCDRSTLLDSYMVLWLTLIVHLTQPGITWKNSFTEGLSTLGGPVAMSVGYSPNKLTDAGRSSLL